MTWEELCEKRAPNELWVMVEERWEKRKHPTPCGTWLHPEHWSARVRVLRYDDNVYVVWGKTAQIKKYPDVETAKVAVLLQGE